MFKARKQLTASLGVATIAGSVGLVALAPSAGAAPVEYTSHCVNQIVKDLEIPDSDLSIDLVVSPAKERYDVGEEVTVTWAWKSYPKAPPEIPIVGKVDKDSTLPKGKVMLGGAASGDFAVEGPRVNPETGPGEELRVSDMTGKVTLDKEGEITLTPGDYSTFTKALGFDAETKCNPVSAVSPSVTLKVGAETPVEQPTVSGPSGVVEPGAELALTGAHFAPGAVTATLDGDAAGIASSSLSADAQGALSGSVTLAGDVADGEHTLKVTDSAGGSAETKVAVKKKADPQPGDLTQNLNGSITAGSLTIGQSGSGVQLGAVPFSGEAQTMSGKLNTVTVNDLRGGTNGWTLTGSISDFTSEAGTIPAENFSWKPSVAKADDKSPGTPVAGSEGPIGSGATLASVAQGTTATGGTFNADADINLSVPAYQATGNYTATLTLSIS